MRLMVKFELEVLSEMTYQMLYQLHKNIAFCRDISEKSKEEARRVGEIRTASDIEATIIRFSENIDTIEVAMLGKEADFFQPLSKKIEPICLN